jgi:hypothetical protein
MVGDLVVEVTALSFGDPRGLYFRYRLIGYDKAPVDAGTTRVVRYSRQRGLIDEVLGGASPGASLSLEALAEWTTPRAWYLCSWWPALLVNRQ